MSGIRAWISLSHACSPTRGCSRCLRRFSNHTQRPVHGRAVGKHLGKVRLDQYEVRSRDCPAVVFAAHSALELRQVILRPQFAGTLRIRPLRSLWDTNTNCPFSAQPIVISRRSQTAGSDHGPGRLADSPALSIALPNAYFDSLGIPRLTVKPIAEPAEPPDADPHVRWCGRGGAVRLPPIPIGHLPPKRLSTRWPHPARNRSTKA